MYVEHKVQLEKNIHRRSDIPRAGDCLLIDDDKVLHRQATSPESQQVRLAPLHLCILSLLFDESFCAGAKLEESNNEHKFSICKPLQFKAQIHTFTSYW